VPASNLPPWARPSAGQISRGTYGICQFCTWEDDADDPDVVSGANGASMRAYRQSELEPAHAAAWIARLLQRRFDLPDDAADAPSAVAFARTIQQLDERGAVLDGPDVLEREHYAGALDVYSDALLRLRSRALWA
jgi:hypothetical protein